MKEPQQNLEFTLLRSWTRLAQQGSLSASQRKKIQQRASLEALPQDLRPGFTDIHSLLKATPKLWIVSGIIQNKYITALVSPISEADGNFRMVQIDNSGRSYNVLKSKTYLICFYVGRPVEVFRIGAPDPLVVPPSPVFMSAHVILAVLSTPGPQGTLRNKPSLARNAQLVGNKAYFVTANRELVEIDLGSEDCDPPMITENVIIAKEEIQEFCFGPSKQKRKIVYVKVDPFRLSSYTLQNSLWTETKSYTLKEELLNTVVYTGNCLIQDQKGRLFTDLWTHQTTVKIVMYSPALLELSKVSIQKRKLLSHLVPMQTKRGLSFVLCLYRDYIIDLLLADKGKLMFVLSKEYQDKSMASYGILPDVGEPGVFTVYGIKFCTKYTLLV